jgi:hypothetical protein
MQQLLTMAATTSANAGGSSEVQSLLSAHGCQ